MAFVSCTLDDWDVDGDDDDEGEWEWEEDEDAAVDEEIASVTLNNCNVAKNGKVRKQGISLQIVTNVILHTYSLGWVG
jgi:hypothetical protein